MTPEQFVYWLQGFSEIQGTKPTEKQWLVIQDHLKLVFQKETPDRNKSDANQTLPVYNLNPPSSPIWTGTSVAYTC